MIPTLTQMEVAIARKFNIRQNVVVPNISWGMDIHECDLLVVRRSGYGVEVEIKRSLSDLKADFKKAHRHHDKRISEFYYALPSELIEKAKSIIPDNIGIIEVSCTDSGSWASVVRKTTKIKSEKFTKEEIYHLARLGTMRVWGLKNKIIDYEVQIKFLKSMVE